MGNVSHRGRGDLVEEPTPTGNPETEGITDFDDIQPTVIGHLTSARRGVGGTTQIDRARLDGTTQVLVESADNQVICGYGQYQSELRYTGDSLSTSPWFLFDQTRASVVRDLGMTATMALGAFIRFQDNQTDPADPGLVYAVNRRSSQNSVVFMQFNGGGLVQDAIQIYKANEASVKNDYHYFERLTIDAYLGSGIVIEGQPSIAHQLNQVVIRSGIGAVTRGLYGVRTGILPTDARRLTWSDIGLEGGTFKMYAGEILDNDIADIYLDSRNGTSVIDGVTMEGSKRCLVVVSPSPAYGLHVIYLVGCKWTSGTLLAADREIIQSEGQSPMFINGNQFGLSSALVELCFYAYSPRDFLGWQFEGNELSTPWRHGHFTGLYPDSVKGSTNATAAGTVTPICYPWDGPATDSGLPGIAKPYYSADWTDLDDNPEPDQWYACQESYQELTVTVVNDVDDELDITHHGLRTGTGPYQLRTTGVAPAGLAIETPYYPIYVDAGSIQLAASLDDALDGVALDITDGGSGTHTLINTERKYVYSLAKDRPRMDLLLRATTEPADWPRLRQRRAIDADAWHSNWVEFTGADGQILSWNDQTFQIDADNYSVAVDLLIDITSAPDDDMRILCLGGSATTGLNLRVMSTGFLKLWCGGNDWDGAVDMTLAGPTWIRLIYDKAGTDCHVVTPFETSANVYDATPGHTQHVGIGASAAAQVSFIGFLNHAALYLGSKAEALDDNLSRFGY